MKSPSPAFSFYPKDILSDEKARVMTLEERGAYLTLLCHAWLEGSILRDPERLARLLGVRPSKLRKMWPAIAECWNTDPDSESRLIQERLEQERKRQRENSKKQSERGKKGGRPKESTEDETRGLAAGKPEESREKAEPKPPFPSPFPVPSAVAVNGTGKPAQKAPRKESWVDLAMAIRAEFFGALEGEAAKRLAIRITKELGPLVRKHTWAKIEPAWRAFHAKEGKYASPEKFAEQPGRWISAPASDNPTGNEESPRARAEREAREERERAGA